MNVRKPVDYGTMYRELTAILAQNLPQMDEIHAIGRAINQRPEKGAAVAAAEFLRANFPDRTGFSPRNVRRMRDFYKTYENDQMLLRSAMKIGWTLNVVIMEAELTREQRISCLRKVASKKLSKKKLLEIILNGTFVEEAVDESAEICYNITKYNYFSANRTGYIPKQCRPTGRCHKWRNSKMDVMGTGLSYIADIGVAAAKKQFNIKLDEKKARAALSDYMERQEKYNFNCSKDEEIDFEGLSKYIRAELLDDVTTRLFGEKTEREAARQTIAKKAALYAQAKTKLSQGRAKQLAFDAVDILRNLFRGKIPKELLLAATEIEDNITSEMAKQHREQIDKINALSDKIDDSFLLSTDRNLMLMNEGKLDQVEQNFATALGAINSKHELAPYYGFAMDGTKQFISVPQLSDATKLYPPHFEVVGKEFKLGNRELSGIDRNTFAQAYRSQIPIEFTVDGAQKYLGDVLDPVQHEAEKLKGKHIIVRPPAFPPAFPCSVIIDGETVVDYLLLRTKRIEDDGTAILMNAEQKGFNFCVVLAMNIRTNMLNLTVTPVNPSNTASLKYRRFLKKAMSACNISLKSLQQNEIIVSSKISLTLQDCERIDDEIEFLQKVVAIEEQFHIELNIPEEITVKDHLIIDRIYSLITVGEYVGVINKFTVPFDLSPEIRNAVRDFEYKQGDFACFAKQEISIFDKKIPVPIIRRIEHLRIDDIDRIKAKLQVLDDGDTIKITFISSDGRPDIHYTDMLYSEEAEQKFFGNAMDAKGEKENAAG